MELLSDVGEVEARFGPFGDGVILDPILVHGLRQMYHRQGNQFLATPDGTPVTP
jgi:hypothetical protein